MPVRLRPARQGSDPGKCLLGSVQPADVLHQYHRAARELWKFCWLGGSGAGVERTARVLRDMAADNEQADWWQLGAPRERDADQPEA